MLEIPTYQKINFIKCCSCNMSTIFPRRVSSALAKQGGEGPCCKKSKQLLPQSPLAYSHGLERRLCGEE